MLLISRWNLGEAVVRSLCEEPLCTSRVGTWEKDRGWVAASASDASVREST